MGARSSLSLCCSLTAVMLDGVVRSPAVAMLDGAMKQIERGRAVSKLIRHPKLQPYMEKISPHLCACPTPHKEKVLLC